VEDAVVEKRLVVVAFERVVFPSIARVPVAVTLPPKKLFPPTVSFAPGEVVPMPTSPVPVILILSLENAEPPVAKTRGSVEAPLETKYNAPLAPNPLVAVMFDEEGILRSVVLAPKPPTDCNCRLVSPVLRDKDALANTPESAFDIDIPTGVSADF